LEEALRGGGALIGRGYSSSNARGTPSSFSCSAATGPRPRTPQTITEGFETELAPKPPPSANLIVERRAGDSFRPPDREALAGANGICVRPLEQHRAAVYCAIEILHRASDKWKATVRTVVRFRNDRGTEAGRREQQISSHLPVVVRQAVRKTRRLREQK